MKLKTKRILISQSRGEAMDLLQAGYIPFGVLPFTGTGACNGVAYDPDQVYVYFYLPKEIKRLNDIEYFDN